MSSSEDTFGGPIVNGTKITTEALACLIRGGEKIEDVAQDFRLEQEQLEMPGSESGVWPHGRIYFDENFSPHLVAGIRAIQGGLRSEDVVVASVEEDQETGYRLSDPLVL